MGGRGVSGLWWRKTEFCLAILWIEKEGNQFVCRLTLSRLLICQCKNFMAVMINKITQIQSKSLREPE